MPLSDEVMKKAGRTCEPVTCEGAGHAFMRRNEDENPGYANKKAMEKAWEGWLGILERRWIVNGEQ